MLFLFFRIPKEIACFFDGLISHICSSCWCVRIRDVLSSGVEWSVFYNVSVCLVFKDCLTWSSVSWICGIEIMRFGILERCLMVLSASVPFSHRRAGTIAASARAPTSATMVTVACARRVATTTAAATRHRRPLRTLAECTKCRTAELDVHCPISVQASTIVHLCSS